MSKSQLGKLLRGIRLKKNISELKAARRCQLEVDEYNRFENDPTTAPLNILKNIFNAIEMTEEDLLDFQTLSNGIYGLPETAAKNPDLTAIESTYDVDRKTPVNTIDFVNKNGIKKNNTEQKDKEV